MKSNEKHGTILRVRIVDVILRLCEKIRESYADKLSVTPQYLSKVTKEKSGKSAMELIENYVIEHIKNTLLREDRNLKDLADDFSFGSFDLMNKYFKRRTGVSLSEYRKNGRLCLEKAGVELPYNT